MLDEGGSAFLPGSSINFIYNFEVRSGLFYAMTAGITGFLLIQILPINNHTA